MPSRGRSRSRADQATAPQWTPADWGSRLHAGWIADYGVTESGGLATQWDARWNNISAAPFTASGGLRPATEAAKWGGRKVFYSDGTKQWRSSANITIPRPFSVIVVGTMSSPGGMPYYLGDAFGDAGAWYLSNNLPAMVNLGGASSAVWSTYNWTNGHAMSANAPTVWVQNVGTTHATHEIYSNGYAWPKTSAIGNNPGSTSFVGRVNLFRDNAGSYPATGRISAVYILSGASTADDRNKIQKFTWNYLSMKRRWELGILGDSLLAPYGSLNPVRSYIYTSSEDPADSAAFDYSTPNEKVTDQTNRYNGIAAGASGGCGSIKGVDCAKAFIEMDGINDILAGVSSSTILTNKQNRINSIKSNNPSARILVAKLLPSSFLSGAQQTVRTAVNSGIDSLTSVDRVISAHIASQSSGGLGNGSDTALYAGYDSGDTLHENNAARAVLGSIFRSELQTYGNISF